MTKEEARQARIEAEEKVVITMMNQMIILTKIGEDLSGPKDFDPKLCKFITAFHLNFSSFSLLFSYVRA